jgi:hypothetical protein
MGKCRDLTEKVVIDYEAIKPLPVLPTPVNLDDPPKQH